MALSLALFSFSASASDVDTDPKFPVGTFGNASASVKVMVFLSPSCTDSGGFYRGILQQLKTEYADSGKILLSIYPFIRNDEDVDIAARLACVRRDFSETMNWYFRSVPSVSSAQRIAARTSFPLPEKEACREYMAYELLTVAMSERVKKLWKPTATPFVVVNGEQLSFPASSIWSNLVALIGKHEGGK